MYARVVTGRFKADALDRGLALLEGHVRPHISKRPGFQGWTLLVARESGAFQAITHWSSQVEADGASRDGFTDRAGMLTSLLEGDLGQAVYEVVTTGA